MNTNNTLSAEIDRLSKIIELNPDNDSAFYERGKLYWRMGRKADAMTDFNAAVHINPESPARLRLEMANDIMSFFNTDILNP